MEIKSSWSRFFFAPARCAGAAPTPLLKKKGNFRDRTCRAENGIDYKL